MSAQGPTPARSNELIKPPDVTHSGRWYLRCQDGQIEPERPRENGCRESFSGKLRDELLNGKMFYSLKEAKVMIEAGRRHYNAPAAFFARPSPGARRASPPVAPEVPVN